MEKNKKNKKKMRKTGPHTFLNSHFLQITRTMQIPLAYAEDIIGMGGKNIAYIRRSSGAIVTLQEGRGLPDEMVIEIKGTAPQVQAAQQLIHVRTLCASPRVEGGHRMISAGPLCRNSWGSGRNQWAAAVAAAAATAAATVAGWTQE